VTYRLKHKGLDYIAVRHGVSDKGARVSVIRFSLDDLNTWTVGSAPELKEFGNAFANGIHQRIVLSG
jgi:hypothetical protein